MFCNIQKESLQKTTGSREPFRLSVCCFVTFFLTREKSKYVTCWKAGICFYYLRVILTSLESFRIVKNYGIILQQHTMNDRLLHDAMYLIIVPYKNSISYSISYFYSAYFKTSKILTNSNKEYIMFHIWLLSTGHKKIICLINRTIFFCFEKSILNAG